MATFSGGAGGDRWVGGGDDDTATGGGGDDTLMGGGGADRLDGGKGDDVLMGGAGDDLLVSGLGADHLDGGVGHDIADYSAIAVSLTVDLAAGAVTGRHVSDTLTSIEEVIGGSANDVISAGAGSATLHGGGGDDLLRAAPVGGESHAFDVLDGGDGHDIADFSAATAAGVFDTKDNTVSFDGLATARLVRIEAVWAGSGDDLMIGARIPTALSGGDGADTLRGVGEDTLSGDAGNDVIDFTAVGGLQGVMHGGDGDDSITTVGKYASAIIDGDAGNDTLTTAGGGEIDGGLGDDLIRGVRAASRMDGGDGDDTVIGSDAGDEIFGGAGTNVLDGRRGIDTVDYGATTGVFVDLATHHATASDRTDTLRHFEIVDGSKFSDVIIGDARDNQLIDLYGGDDSLTGGGGNDQLIAGSPFEARKEADTLNGGAGNDTMVGGGGGDILSGGKGADLLFGDYGDDSLYGGKGDDRFLFDYFATGDVDRIFDLQAGDVIDLSRIDANLAKPGDQHFKLVGFSHHKTGEAVLTFHASGHDAGKTTLELYVHDPDTPDETIVIDGDHTDFTGFTL